MAYNTIMFRLPIVVLMGILYTIGNLSLLSLVATMVLVLGLNLRYPFSFKNYFLLYVFLMFFVTGSHFFPADASLDSDMFVYLGSFLMGYYLLRWDPSMKPLLYIIKLETLVRMELLPFTNLRQCYFSSS